MRFVLLPRSPSAGLGAARSNAPATRRPRSSFKPSSTMTAYGRRRVTFGRLEMDGAWVTYAEAAARLGLSVEAVRQRAIRNKWARMLANDKRARVRLPDEPYPTQTPTVRASDQALMDALREHNATLKADIERLEAQLRIEADRLARAEARAEKQAANRPSSSPPRGSGPTRRLPRSQLWRGGSTRWRPSERARGGGGSWDRSRHHACTYAPRHARPREQFGASARP